jgi:hypothetical protein
MTPPQTDSVSRRTALAGISATGLGLALAATTHHASAQHATPTAMAGHPIIGTWIVDRNPEDETDPPTAVVYTPDGGWIDPILGVAGSGWPPARARRHGRRSVSWPRAPGLLRPPYLRRDR